MIATLFYSASLFLLTKTAETILCCYLRMRAEDVNPVRALRK